MSKPMTARVREVLAKLSDEFIVADVIRALGVEGDQSPAVSHAVHWLCDQGEVEHTGRTELRKGLRGARQCHVFRKLSAEAIARREVQARCSIEAAHELQRIIGAWTERRGASNALSLWTERRRQALEGA